MNRQCPLIGVITEKRFDWVTNGNSKNDFWDTNFLLPVSFRKDIKKIEANKKVLFHILHIGFLFCFRIIRSEKIPLLYFFEQQFKLCTTFIHETKTKKEK